jgi:hypothetical protein
VRLPRRMHVLAAITVTVSLVHFAVAPTLPADAQLPFQAISLAVSMVCLVLLAHQLRQLHRQRAATAEAVGGPCDGQRIALPTGTVPPREIWLSQPAANGDYRYLRAVARPGLGLRYVYEPPMSSQGTGASPAPE